MPDWFYRAVLDDALVLTIDREYFGLTGGLERWLYRIVRKHAGTPAEAAGISSFGTLRLNPATLSPFKRFAFELRDIARRQPLPGYRLGVCREPSGRELLIFAGSSTAICGQAVDGLVLSGTAGHVLSGTGLSCYQEPKSSFSPNKSVTSSPPNLDSNQNRI